MNRMKSLTFKFVAGFIIIISPLVIFLFVNNLYAISVVREQVSGANTNLLTGYVKQIDKQMKEINNYLSLINDREPDVNLLNFTEYGSDDYMLAKQKIFTRFQVDLGYFQIIDTIFLYNIKDNDIVLNTRSDYYRNETIIADYIAAHPTDDGQPSAAAWKLIQIGDEMALVKMVRNNNLVVGAWIRLNSIVESLQFQDLEYGGGTAIVADDRAAATSGRLMPSQLVMISEMTAKLNETYQIVTDPVDKQSYLLVGIPSAMAPVHYAVLIPEANMLKNLPFFRLAIYMIPLGGLLILLFYFIFVRKVLLTPMTKLIRGMQSIIRGDWNVRLEEGHSTEFAFVIRTFNNMVGEIVNLKINVYEQRLLTKEAEFKHLQVQIKPHFYLNSLNIITSLAATRQYDIIQKMSRHLAEYFRFNISTYRRSVTIEAEMNHVRNYLEIQKLRFPGKLAYEIHLPEDLQACAMLPLTIQTLVENSIIHGFVNRHELFVISIDITKGLLEQGEEVVWIRVADNGIGFITEVLDRLASGAFHEASPPGHLGIHNVLLRLQLRYEGKARVVFGNGEEQGAVVTIGIPIMYEGDDEHEH